MEERDYGLSDPKMIEFMGTYRQLFLNHIAPFIELDGELDAPFEADWRDAINASIAVPTAEYRQDVGQGKTARVEQQMTLGRKAYRYIKYFVVKAYPTDISMQNRFSFDNYLGSSNSQAEMVIVLREIHTTASEPAIKAALFAKGYTQPKLDEINTICETLEAENIDQNTFLAESPVATKARRAIHNTTWSFGRRVNAASKIAFMDDLVMLNLFTLPVSSGAPETFNVLGTVVDSVTGNPIASVSVKIGSLSLVTTTDEFGKFGFTEMPLGVFNVDYTAPGYVPFNQEVTVTASGAVANATLTPAP